MDPCIVDLANRFLDITKQIFEKKGFLFSTAFIVGRKIEIMRLDLSSEAKKQQYSRVVKQHFLQSQASHLIVIQEAWVYQVTPEELQGLDVDSCEEPDINEHPIEALLVFVSSPCEGEVWQIPFIRNKTHVLFAEKEVLKTVVSANWMMNPNQHRMTHLN